MGTVRLTNNMKEDIKNNVLRYRFEKEILELFSKMAKLAEDVYNDAFKGELEKLQAVPEGWLPTTTSIHVQFGSSDYYIGLAFNGSTCRKLKSFIDVDSIFKIVPYNRVHSCIGVYGTEHDFSKRYRNLRDLESNLVTKVSTAESEIRNILYKPTTVNKLLEVWPEVRPFVSEVPRAEVVYIDTSKANELLDLPVPEEAVA